ncbi:MAG TPA: hypothetical protein VFY71_10230 [Planctomycetota bacterium]|nr:hypothetical protein [Planctomycetota bacterium]
MTRARSRFRRLAGLGLLVAALLPAGAAQQARAPEAALSARRDRMLAVARSYAGFDWQGSARNVLHGPDANGVQVDTPDVSFDARGWKPDATNHGMPYAWGGFTSIEEFRAGVAQDRPAGQVPTTERARPSAVALGLDCSGFIARAWELPVKQSTRSLGALCYPLPGQSALQPGDILDLFDSHVVLFERWVDEAHTHMLVFEAGRLAVTESDYAAADLQRRGFQPLRYKPLDQRWVPMTLGEPAFSAEPSADGHWTAGGDGVPLDPATAASPLRDARPLQWARYAVTGNDPQFAGDCERVTLVSAAEGERVDTQSEARLPGGTISTGRSCAHAAQLVDALVDFAAPDEPLTAITLREGTVAAGVYELAGRSFPAQRIEAQLDATHVVRHQDLPVTITVTCILSPEVAVHGVLEASFRFDTVWSAEPGEEPLVGRHTSSFALRACGGPPR